MFYIFYGSDEFSIAEAITSLKQRLAATDPLAGLNTLELDGRELTLAELRATADTIPFFGERRLVIVRGLLGRCNQRQGDAKNRKALAEGLIAYLPHVAPTCRLVLAEGQLDAQNPVLRWVQAWLREAPHPEEAAYVREFETPPVHALPAWLHALAAAMGSRLEPAAAEALAEALVRDKAVDLRLAASELEKLALYADGRTISLEDVMALVSPVSLSSVFAFVDALAARDGPEAATQLHRFLNAGEPPLRLLTLIGRQFRLLIRTKALLDAGTPPAGLASALAVPPFVASKLSGQARRFAPAQLMTSLTRLRDLDTDIKTGQVEPVLGLDLFVSWICGPAPAGGVQL